MLLTFSRRAAAEMTRRVDLLLSEFSRRTGTPFASRCRGPARSTLLERGCCANMPKPIGLAPAFTIHDREDSADLINLVRYDLGYSKMEKRFPGERHVPRIYSRVVNSEQQAR